MEQRAQQRRGVRIVVTALVVAAVGAVALAVPLVGRLDRARPVAAISDVGSASRRDRAHVRPVVPPVQSRVTRRAGRLAGRLVVIDPGHQLGNHNFPDQINRLVPAGGFEKPCNTTGTATDAGYPEATFAWRVAQRLRSRLMSQGARVLLTRHSNSEDLWGPCVDVRGRAGNRQHADLKISIHGDGTYATDAHGFHVIAPTDRAPWTHDIYRTSRRLAKVARAALVAQGFSVANYVADGTGIDYRSDLGTINLSNIPTILVELGNMRDSGDARTMTSPAGRGRYAQALAAAVDTYLG